MGSRGRIWRRSLVGAAILAGKRYSFLPSRNHARTSVPAGDPQPSMWQAERARGQRQATSGQTIHDDLIVLALLSRIPAGRASRVTGRDAKVYSPRSRSREIRYRYRITLKMAA